MWLVTTRYSVAVYKSNRINSFMTANVKRMKSCRLRSSYVSNRDEFEMSYKALLTYLPAIFIHVVIDWILSSSIILKPLLLKDNNWLKFSLENLSPC